MNKHISAALFAALIAVSGAGQAASIEAQRFASCLERSMSSSDRKVLVQWAFASLARTSAAREVAVVPEAKIRGVEAKAQKTLAALVVKSCSKEGLKLAFKDPKNGLQDSLASLAQNLVKKEIERRTSPLLSLSITDILK